jgi:hypothetical protein
VPTNKRIGVAALVLIVIVSGYFLVFGLRTTRVETIQKQLNEGLQMGASPENVTRFLDAIHLEHSELIRPEVMLMNRRSYDNALVIVAVRRNTWRSLLQRESVQVIFVFDESHKLVRIDVFPIYTGL